MVRGGAAAAADHVDEAGGGELTHQPAHGFGALVIEAEFVGKTRIRIGADQGVGDARQFRDVAAHLLGAERAIQPDGEGAGMPQRVPERLRGLARKGAAGKICDRTRDHDRQDHAALLEHRPGGSDRRLGVERVEDRLDQDQFGAAIHQAAHLLHVGRLDPIEGHGTVAGIVHVRRDRQGAVRRADGAGHEAAAAIVLLGQSRGLAGEAGAFRVQLVDDRFHAVIGLGDGGAREGVGLADVGAGQEIVEVDLPDRVGLRQDQEVVVALLVVARDRVKRPPRKSASP